jgi:hypothetical protein
MKVLTKAALTALLAGSIGVAGLVPSYADNAAPGAQTPPAAQSPASPSAMPHPGGMAGRAWGPWRGHPPMAGHHGGSWLMRLACSDRGSEALEIAFVRLKYDLKLTASQQPLFETLRSAALADQKSFADTCKAAMDDGVAPGQRTLLDRLQTELALDSAKVTALSDIVPKFKAFYDSLSDQQKAQLHHIRPRGAHFGSQGGWDHQQRPGWHPGMMRGWHPGMMHGRHPAAPDATPPAPEAAPGAPNPPAPADPATTPGQS